MKVNFFILLAFIFILTGCLEKEYQPVPPQLKIIVKNNYGDFVDQATVKLYETEEDFLNDNNNVDFGLTDSIGNIVFLELQETTYFFRIEKGGQSNLESNYSFKEPLKRGERKVVTTSIL